MGSTITPFSNVNTQQASARQEEEIPRIKNADVSFYQSFLKKARRETILVYNIDTQSYGFVDRNGGTFNGFGGGVVPPPVPAKNFQGIWDANTNTPAIPVATPGTSGNADFYYYVGTAGNTTIDGTTNWQVGDFIQSIGSKWVRVGASTPDILYKTRIQITANKVANSPILTNASGVGFTKSLQNTYLDTNSGLFGTNNKIRILLNGNELAKNDGVTFVTSVSFAINKPLAIGEVIEIYSDQTI